MKKLALLTASLLIASQAMAQAVIPNAPEPAATAPVTVPAPAPSPAVPMPAGAPAAPAPSMLPPGTSTPAQITPTPAVTAPTAPIVAPVSMAPAGVTSYPAVAESTTLATTPAPTSTAPTIDLNSIVGKLAGNGKGTNNSSQQLGQVMAIGSIMGCTQKAVGKPATDAFYQQMQGVTKNIEAYCKQGNPTQARALALDTLNQKHNDPVAKAALNCYDTQKTSLASMAGQQTATDAEHYARWLRDPTTAKAEMQESDVCRKSKPTANQ